MGGMVGRIRIEKGSLFVARTVGWWMAGGMYSIFCMYRYGVWLERFGICIGTFVSFILVY